MMTKKIVAEIIKTNLHIPLQLAKKGGWRRKNNTPGTAGGPGGRDRTLAVKSQKIARKSAFFHKK